MSVHKKNSTLMEELERFAEERDRDKFIETRANNLISGVQNLIDLIESTYTEETARDLQKRLINGLRTGDQKKFQRGVQKIKKGKG